MSDLPLFLVGLAVLVVGAAWVLGSGRATIPHPSLEAARRLSSRRRGLSWMAALRWVSLALLVVALGRPQIGAQRPGDRIALVQFARRPRLVCPRTFDHELFQSMLAELEPAVPRSEDDGTAVGAAVAEAVRGLESSSPRSRVVVLLTDGENNVDDVTPALASRLCRERSVKLYCIGFGSGFATAARDSGGLGLLAKMARVTGGQSFVAADPGELQRIYRRIDLLERPLIERTAGVVPVDRFGWFALLAFVLLSLAMGLDWTVLRRLP